MAKRSIQEIEEIREIDIPKPKMVIESVLASCRECGFLIKFPRKQAWLCPSCGAANL